jgi:hypothetical protein
MLANARLATQRDRVSFIDAVAPRIVCGHVIAVGVLANSSWRSA